VDFLFFFKKLKVRILFVKFKDDNEAPKAKTNIKSLMTKYLYKVVYIKGKYHIKCGV